ncbi:MAG: CPBP family intramembrane metalloprotease [Deltaproteobacteria bacterium]|nr:CPBP family intramembrane metalloprotease [Deltaproteobacteria bacterium]
MRVRSDQKNLFVELGVVTLGLVIISRILFSLRSIPFINEWLSTFIAVLFLYVPILVLWKQRRPIDFLDRSARDTLRGLAAFAVTSLLIFPLFFLVAMGWQKWVVGLDAFHLPLFPGFLSAVAYQVLLVALPEEFYFRGYFQSTLNRVFEKRWNIFGVSLGWSWIVTALVFAFAHSAITFRWWHFSIFFPALVFGYLRERTGSITAPILFHAASNLFMEWFVRGYL